MPAWAPILGEEGVKQVVAYVLTLRNTEVPGVEPQGEIWEPGGTLADDGAGSKSP
jgi:cytochrome c oxidase cbb3-type subunit 3